MKDYGFIAFLFDTMLREVFVTKVNMAAQLGVNHRTLQINFQRLNYRKGGTVACENLFLYCLEHGYSLNGLYKQYLDERELKKGGNLQFIQVMSIRNRSHYIAA